MDWFAGELHQAIQSCRFASSSPTNCRRLHPLLTHKQRVLMGVHHYSSVSLHSLGSWRDFGKEVSVRFRIPHIEITNLLGSMHNVQERDEDDALLVIGARVVLITYPRCRPSLLVRAWGRRTESPPHDGIGSSPERSRSEGCEWDGAPPLEIAS